MLRDRPILNNLSKTTAELYSVGASRFGLIAISTANTVLLTRLLPLEELGAWFATVAFGLLSTAVLQLGVSPALVRGLGSLTLDARRAVAAATRPIACAFLVFSAAVLVSSTLDIEWAPLSAPIVVLPYVLALLGQRIASDTSRGLHDVAGATLLSGIVDRAAFFLVVAVLVTLNVRTSFELLLLISTALTIATTGLLVPRVVRLVKKHSCENGLRPDFSLRSTWRLWLTSVLGIFLSSGDILIVSLTLGPEEAAIYGLASRVAVLISVPLQVVNATAPHRLSYLHSHGETRSMARLASSLASVSTVGAAAMLLLVMGASVAFLPNLFAVSRGDLTGPLIMLALGQFINAAMGPAGLVLVASRYDSAVLWSNALSAGLILIGVPAVGSHMGLAGASLAAALALAAANLARVHLVKQRFGVRVDGLQLRSFSSIRSDLKLGQR